MPEISVIMPVYNSEKYLKACIDSVLNQTYTDFELICVDDGSTDSSPEILDSITDTRIKVIHQKNGGGSASRNKGLDLVSGKFFTFIDNDDMYSPDYLKILRAGFDFCEKADVVCCNGYGFWDEPNFWEIKPEQYQFKKLAHPFIKKYMFRRHYQMYMWTKMYRTETLGHLRFDLELPTFNDIIYNFEMALYSKILVKTEVSIYAYRQHDHQQMNKPFNEKYIKQCFELSKSIKRLGEKTNFLYRMLLARENVKIMYNTLYSNTKSSKEAEIYAKQQLAELIDTKTIDLKWLSKTKRKNLIAYAKG